MKKNYTIDKGIYKMSRKIADALNYKVIKGWVLSMDDDDLLQVIQNEDEFVVNYNNKKYKYKTDEETTTKLDIVIFLSKRKKNGDHRFLEIIDLNDKNEIVLFWGS